MQFRDFLVDSQDAPLFVHVHFAGGVLRVKPVGPSIGQREAPIIANEVASAITSLTSVGRPLRAVVVDLSEVRVLCSMGIGAIIDIRNRAAGLRAKPILFGLRPEIAALIKLVKIERLYKIAKSAAEVEKLAA